MEKFIIDFIPKRETKNTVVFMAIAPDEFVDPVYVNKRAFNGRAIPRKIRMTVEEIS